jgi:hypothetical protein
MRRSLWGALRGSPDMSLQRTPGGASQVGQRTERVSFELAGLCMRKMSAAGSNLTGLYYTAFAYTALAGFQARLSWSQQALNESAWRGRCFDTTLRTEQSSWTGSTPPIGACSSSDKMGAGCLKLGIR